MDQDFPGLVFDASVEPNELDAVSYQAGHSRIFGTHDECALDDSPLDLSTDFGSEQNNMLSREIKSQAAEGLAEVDVHRGNEELSTYSQLSSSPRIIDLDVPEAHSSPRSAHNTQPTNTESATALAIPQAPTQPSVRRGSNLYTRRSRKAAKPASKQDWAKFRPLITTLYAELTLEKVMQRMEREHGFVTSDKSYKRRIKEWGLEKKHKEKEMRAIVRKYAHRKANSKLPSFRVRGQEVDYQEMIRYFARKGVSIDDMMTQRKTSPTPEAVVCITPFQSPISTPKVYGVPESVFAAVRDYINGSFDSGTWIKTEPIVECFSVKEGGVYTKSSAIHDFLYSCSWESSQLRILNDDRAANKAQNSAIAALRQVLKWEHPRALSTLFALSADTFSNNMRSEIVFALVQTLADLGPLLLANQHPFARIAQFLRKLDESQFCHTGVQSLRVMADSFEKNLGPMHWTSLFAKSDHVSLDTARQLLRRCQVEVGVNDFRTFEVHLRVLSELLKACQYQLAIHESHHLLSTIDILQPVEFKQHYRAAGLCYLARCQWQLLSDRDLAVTTLRAAIDVRISIWGSADNLIKPWIVELLRWLTELRREEEVEEVRLWYHLLCHCRMKSQEQAETLTCHEQKA